MERQEKSEVKQDIKIYNFEKRINSGDINSEKKQIVLNRKK